ncbi:hypothetical protein G3M48_002328, partial [Beauveria asiatica]
RTDFSSLPAWERYEIVSDFVALLGGRHSNIAHNTHNRFTEAGFVNIISRNVKLLACHLDGDPENRIAALHSILDSFVNYPYSSTLYDSSICCIISLVSTSDGVYVLNMILSRGSFGTRAAWTTAY